LEEREEEREEKWAVSLQPPDAHVPKNSVREKGEPISKPLYFVDC